MATSVLITGASGLVGARLTGILIQKGYHVSHLGRSAKSGKVPSYVWNVDRGEMDSSSLAGVDVIINLAGSGVAEKRWTKERKRNIRESRTGSCRLLLKTLKNTKHQVKTFIGASAIGYYGYNLHENVLAEDAPAGKDYLAGVVVDWEKASDQLESAGLRVVKIRIGIVLAKEGGALVEMAGPVKWGIGSPLASGKQMMSWIHLDDLCNIFVKAIEDSSFTGAYNAVAPQPVTNREMTKEIARTLHRPFFMPSVPAFVLKLMLGEMAEIVIHGAAISSGKIQKSGFVFQYPRLTEALKNIYQ